MSLVSVVPGLDDDNLRHAPRLSPLFSPSNCLLSCFFQDKDACRKLKYPSLDLLYSACRDAHIDCAHVYLYRDPHAIIKSTSINRHFNDNILQGMHLYISMLHILYGQLSRHASRTLGCFGFLEPNVTNEEVWEPFREIFGWQDRAKYYKSMEEAYKPQPHILTDEDRAAIIPKNYQVYTNSFASAHEDMVQLCRNQVAATGSLAHNSHRSSSSVMTT